MSDQSTSSNTPNSDNLSSKEIQNIFSHDENRNLSDNHSDEKKSNQQSQKEKDVVSIIYYQRKDSPKYFEIKKSVFFWWFVVLPTVTLVALAISIFAAIQISPTHLIQNYLSARNYSSMKDEIESLKSDNEKLQEDLKAREQELLELKKGSVNVDTNLAQNESTVENANNPNTENNDLAANKVETKIEVGNKTSHSPLEPVTADPAKKLSPQSFGLSYLSLFKPVIGQKDRTRPAQISLSGFNVTSLRDTISLRFNITPLLPNEQKIAGHILVIMKGETGLQVYPQMSLNAPDAQISYSAGESFATQRFRPVDASFLKPRKSGQFVFTVLIFAKNGDLIHTQTVPLFVRI